MDTVAENCCDCPTPIDAALGVTATDTAAANVTVALPDFVVSATLTAVTVTGLFGIRAGATYMPVLDTVPSGELPPAIPFTFQVTEVLDVPKTEAANCCDRPMPTVVVDGVTETETGAVTVTPADADLLGSETLVALTATATFGTVLGAVYRPVLETVPVLEPPPATPFTAHLTELSAAPTTVAVNCWDCPTPTVDVGGVIETETGGVTVTAADADLLGSETLVALTTTATLGTALGAV